MIETIKITQTNREENISNCSNRFQSLWVCHICLRSKQANCVRGSLFFYFILLGIFSVKLCLIDHWRAVLGMSTWVKCIYGFPELVHVAIYDILKWEELRLPKLHWIVGIDKWMLLFRFFFFFLFFYLLISVEKRKLKSISNKR